MNLQSVYRHPAERPADEEAAVIVRRAPASIVEEEESEDGVAKAIFVIDETSDGHVREAALVTGSLIAALSAVFFGMWWAFH